MPGKLKSCLYYQVWPNLTPVAHGSHFFSLTASTTPLTLMVRSTLRVALDPPATRNDRPHQRRRAA